ncbi:IS3 family transposase [Aerococcus urinaeequi]|uniref:IS3 family transposase n=1 Tax=Aerococcus urinaeequi TaxID=51665 RepID=UPI0022E00A7A|nr:IS3 family transposase [Aerococcus urinaeequi]
MAYQMKRYSKNFKDNDIFQSMPRKGNCYNNSPIESFFGRMKDVVLSEISETLQGLCYVVEAYIEFHKNHRYQKKLKKMTPTTYWDHLLWAV